ncbi:MAG: transcription antitermination factor NusB [Caldilineae bacterium]|nr:transcription antitermination factor NusB [Chloroflexota bacterium]MCB9176174.1 transcription antitermination factor NusB [Caldilineae bacterium]
MKGRRRARQLALQALYELDSSEHPVADVLAARLDAYYRSVLRNQPDGPVPDRLVEPLIRAVDLRRDAERPWSDFDPTAIVERHGLDPARVAFALAQLIEHEGQGAYAVQLVRGVVRNLAAIDAVIGRIAPEWPVEQIAPVDRNCLRIALWEIGAGAAPLRVVINEAVELARRFSGEGARRMVNGALGAFAASGVVLAFAGYEPAS